jgi:hypothetical protein
MKNILLILMLAICTPALADVYVITDKDGGIYSISEQDDAVLPAGYSKDIIKGKMIGDLALDGDLSLYKFNGKKFTIDTNKVAERRKQDADLAQSIEDNKNARVTAIGKLKTLGLTDLEISALMGK